MLAALTLAACDPEKTPISGTRIPVVNYASSLTPDRDAKDIDVHLPLSEIGRDWPQAGGEADHVMPNFSIPETLSPFWTASTNSGGDTKLLASPIVAEGTAYVLDTYGNVTAIETHSGNTLWEAPVTTHDGPFLGGGLAYGQGKVFVTSPHAEALALDAKTGQIMWRVPMPSPVRAAPTFANDRLYILTISNQLEVLNAENGAPLWNHVGITEYAGLLGTTSPAVANGVVIVPYSSGEIYALKTENGHQLWTQTLTTTRRPDSLSSLSHIKALPIVGQNMVVIVGHNQKMAVYDLRRGEKLWERRIGGTRTPAVIGDFIFMISSLNELLCLTLKHGQVVWIKKLPSDPDSPHKVIWEGPLVAGGKLYLTNISGELVSFDPTTGGRISSLDLASSFVLPPFSAQEILYLLSQDGNLIALH